MMLASSLRRSFVVAAVFAAIAGCASIAREDRAWFETDGKLAVVPLGCTKREALAWAPGALSPHRPLKVVVWNIHRNADAGWEADLSRFASESDLVLLQEATLTGELRTALARAGRHFIHADAWALDDVASGVLTASTAAPYEACVQRVREPLITLPKSVMIAWYRIEGRTETLAVANVHAINFTLELGAYNDQLDAVAAVLASHRGPLILAGDFNTWSAIRVDSLLKVAERIGVVEVRASRGERSRFLGMPADYLFVRGLTVDDAWVEDVRSSDHVPIRASLRFDR
jgi:endonuclease/exonuclease/phosphatase (EEP) superfamily protein YafD